MLLKLNAVFPVVAGTAAAAGATVVTVDFGFWVKLEKENFGLVEGTGTLRLAKGFEEGSSSVCSTGLSRSTRTMRRLFISPSEARCIP